MSLLSVWTSTGRLLLQYQYHYHYWWKAFSFRREIIISCSCSVAAVAASSLAECVSTAEDGSSEEKTALKLELEGGAHRCTLKVQLCVFWCDTDTICLKAMLRWNWYQKEVTPYTSPLASPLFSFLSDLQVGSSNLAELVSLHSYQKTICVSAGSDFQRWMFDHVLLLEGHVHFSRYVIVIVIRLCPFSSGSGNDFEWCVASFFPRRARANKQQLQ